MVNNKLADDGCREKGEDVNCHKTEDNEEEKVLHLGLTKTLLVNQKTPVCNSAHSKSLYVT